MLIFLVTINTGVDFYSKAERIITEVGAKSYSTREEFSVDGVQDPYRAVDESDAVIWVSSRYGNDSIEHGDYNTFYGDTVLRRAVRNGKPLLYYQVATNGSSEPFPEGLQTTPKRTLESLSEIEEILRIDLTELMTGTVPRKR